MGCFFFLTFFGGGRVFYDFLCFLRFSFLLHGFRCVLVLSGLVLLRSC